MRELTKKLLRIVIGGVLTITGIISGSYALVQIPDGASWYMPYVVISILTLLAGLYLCFFSIKLPHYLVKSRKMSKEEKTIKSMKKYIRQRNIHIALITFSLVITASTFIWLITLESKFSKTITSEDIRLQQLFKLIFYELCFCLCTGSLIAALIIEISGYHRNRYRLTISMWERIQELEGEVRELKAGTQADGQQISDMDGGDSTSGVE